jgi:hypothetical protein
MLFRDIIAVYCENHTEHTNTLCGQNAEFLYVEAGGAYKNRAQVHMRQRGNCPATRLAEELHTLRATVAYTAHCSLTGLRNMSSCHYREASNVIRVLK